MGEDKLHTIRIVAVETNTGLYICSVSSMLEEGDSQTRVRVYPNYLRRVRCKGSACSRTLPGRSLQGDRLLSALMLDDATGGAYWYGLASTDRVAQAAVIAQEGRC
jgi:hypothetical protein